MNCSSGSLQKSVDYKLRFFPEPENPYNFARLKTVQKKNIFSKLYLQHFNGTSDSELMDLRFEAFLALGMVNEAKEVLCSGNSARMVTFWT